jgi:CubicO group peptidase (beta-lactamase class C family)
MKPASFAIFAGIITFQACDGSHGRQPPRVNEARRTASHIDVDSATQQQTRSRLKNTAAPLVQSPFGTAAVVTFAVGSAQTTAALGFIWEGGPTTTESTQFNVASVSKVLTAARVVSLADAKAIVLDDPVSKYLPGVKLIDRSGIDQAGAISVRQLVQHRGGLPQVPKDLEQKLANRGSSADLLRVLTDSWAIALEGTPGEYKYSNTGYALLGAIIERVSECSFAECMDTYLNELGMMRSTYWPLTLGEDAAPGRVAIKGSVKLNPPGWYASRYALPFSGLWTSMPDLARFGSLLVAASKNAASPLHAMTTTDGPTLGLFRNTRLDVPSLEHDGSAPPLCQRDMRQLPA